MEARDGAGPICKRPRSRCKDGHPACNKKICRTAQRDQNENSSMLNENDLLFTALDAAALQQLKDIPFNCTHTEVNQQDSMANIFLNKSSEPSQSTQISGRQQSLDGQIFSDDELDLFDDDDMTVYLGSSNPTGQMDIDDSFLPGTTLHGMGINTIKPKTNIDLLCNVDNDSKNSVINCHLNPICNNGHIARPSNSVKPSDTMSSSTLKDRLKLTMKQNASLRPPLRMSEEDIKQEALRKARLDASQIRKEGTSVDIGPFYGLPEKVQHLYQTNRGIHQLYEWQDQCLQLSAVKEHRNLIYTLPTSGGKTLVAEVLVMRELLCYQRDALLILPYVSIVQEKVRTISEFATELGFLVEEYAGSKGRFPPLKRRKKRSLYIATIEKGHSLINSLIEMDRMESLGLVVVDELHMIGEGQARGATLEACLLKIMLAKADTQIIGMTATLSNLGDLQAFLKAEVYRNDFRPVQLQEYVKIEDNLFAVNYKALHDDDRLEHNRIVSFKHPQDVREQDPDQLFGLVTEVIPEKSCLIFCSNKKNCENVAVMLSKFMCKHRRDLIAVKKDERRQLLKELLDDGEGQLCSVLEYTVHFGIAYHHSGLTSDERKLIEEAYAVGTLCLLTCTSTLAAGVNLPAKRVILRSPYVAADFIRYSQYKQMTGRAGRAGIDTTGESILIAKKQDRMKVKGLLTGPKDVCYSNMMFEGGRGVQSLLLSSIALQSVTSMESALDLLKNSLLFIQSSQLEVDVEDVTRKSIESLVEAELIVEVQIKSMDGITRSTSLKVTELGKASFKGSVDHTRSSQLYKDLKMAEESLNLATHLHLLYLITPYNTADTVSPDWGTYLHSFCKLSETEIKTATTIGVHESYIGLRASGRQLSKTVNELTIRRFYLTLMLWDLWNQKSVWEVAERFSQPRGFVQNLLSQAAAFASCVFHFCKELPEFWAYQDLMSTFAKRLGHCAAAELIPLMDIPGVKVTRAKQLYAAGFKTLSQLSNADPETLVKCIDFLSRRAAKQMVAMAKIILEEKAAALLEEVDTLIAG